MLSKFHMEIMATLFFERVWPPKVLAWITFAMSGFIQFVWHTIKESG
jgi:hypothetical protein